MCPHPKSPSHMKFPLNLSCEIASYFPFTWISPLKYHVTSLLKPLSHDSLLDSIMWTIPNLTNHITSSPLVNPPQSQNHVNLNNNQESHHPDFQNHVKSTKFFLPHTSPNPHFMWTSSISSFHMLPPTPISCEPLQFQAFTCFPKPPFHVNLLIF